MHAQMNFPVDWAGDLEIFTLAVDGAGNLSVYHNDAQGSVRAITDKDGNVVQLYLDDEFGVQLLQKGTVDQQFKFKHHMYDEDTGLTSMGARNYDSAIGRFLQRDPSGLGFDYAANNPLKNTDPDGARACTQEEDDAGECKVGGDDDPKTRGGQILNDILARLWPFGG
jgi:RHS repeat-associated protein